MHRLLRFRYLGVVLFIAAALVSVTLAALVAWRNVEHGLESAAVRAVFNADRIVDRTVSDLERLDGLRGAPCDAETIRVLQDTVYRSLSQIREVGVIRDGRLYCSNFGQLPKEVPIAANLTQPGVHLEIGANVVMVNNTSLFVYVSREAGRAVNAVFNPQVLAEFERDFAYGGNGQLRLSVEAAQTSADGSNVKKRVSLYSLGDTSPTAESKGLISTRYASSRSTFVAEAEVSKQAWWKETMALLPFTVGVFAIAGVLTFAGIQRWLMRGNLDRLRYQGALARDEFVMHYQPIIAADTLKIVGAEALLRWRHPRRGLLRAAQFIDIFSHDSIARPLTKRVIDLVARDMQTVPKEMPLWCTVNIAPTLLEDNRLMDSLSQQILSIGEHRVQLEITERAPMGESAGVVLHEMRSKGVKVGMDDLGTGYANLSQLQAMPFDFIKIDGMLVRGIRSAESVPPVVRSLIELARELGAEVVVEGVETAEQAVALIDAGASHLQGFYFDAARPIEEIVELLRKEHSQPA